VTFTFHLDNNLRSRHLHTYLICEYRYCNMVHTSAVEAFERNDVELTVPPGEPRPVLLVVMVSYTWSCATS